MHRLPKLVLKLPVCKVKLIIYNFSSDVRVCCLVNIPAKHQIYRYDDCIDNDANFKVYVSYYEEK